MPMSVPDEGQSRGVIACDPHTLYMIMILIHTPPPPLEDGEWDHLWQE